MEDYRTECQYYDIVGVCFVFGNCNHCCFCCGHPCTMLGVSLFISCKNKIQCVCVKKKKKESPSLNFLRCLLKIFWNPPETTAHGFISLGCSIQPAGSSLVSSFMCIQYHRCFHPSASVSVVGFEIMLSMSHPPLEYLWFSMKKRNTGYYFLPNVITFSDMLLPWGP